MNSIPTMAVAVSLALMLSTAASGAEECPGNIPRSPASASIERGNQAILKVERGTISASKLQRFVTELRDQQAYPYDEEGNRIDAEVRGRTAIVMTDVCVVSNGQEPVALRYWNVNHKNDWALLSNFIFENTHFPAGSSIDIDQCGKLIIKGLYGIEEIEFCVSEHEWFDIGVPDLKKLKLTSCNWISYFYISHLDLDEIEIENCDGAFFEMPNARNAVFQNVNFREFEDGIGFDIDRRPGDPNKRTAINLKLETSIKDGKCTRKFFLSDLAYASPEKMSGEFFFRPRKDCIYSAEIGGNFSEFSLISGTYDDLHIFPASAKKTNIRGLEFSGPEPSLTVEAYELRRVVLGDNEFHDDFKFIVKMPSQNTVGQLNLGDIGVDRLFKNLSISLTSNTIPNLNTLSGDLEIVARLFFEFDKYYHDPGNQRISRFERRAMRCAVQFLERHNFTREIPPWCDPFAGNFDE